MNENIDLTKILKNCPKGFRLYSIVHGEVTFSAIENGRYPICVLTDNNNSTAYYSSNGKIYVTRGECILFPSKDQRDWSKFTAYWYKKERFDPKTLKPFDKVLIRNDKNFTWRINIYSHKNNNDNNYHDKRYPYVCITGEYSFCIPYNDETKHLVGTTEEAPDFYRYWED